MKLFVASLAVAAHAVNLGEGGVISGMEETLMSFMQGNTPVAVPASHAEAGSVSSMEDTLLALLKQGNTPALKNITAEFVKVLRDQMKPKVQDHRREEQAKINKAASDVGQCATSFASTQRSLTTVRSNVDSAKKSHYACRSLESKLQLELELAGKLLVARQDTWKVKCDAVKNIRAPKECKALTGESYEQMNLRLLNQFDALHTIFTRATSECRNATRDRDSQDASVKRLQSAYSSKKQECDKLQTILDSSACDLVEQSNSSCTSNNRCYSGRTAAFEQVVKAAKAQEAGMATEWEAFLRMECLTNVFGLADDQKAAGIQNCRSKDEKPAALAAVRLTVPGLSKPMACPALPAQPESALYIRDFLALPKNAPAAQCMAKCCRAFTRTTTTTTTTTRTTTTTATTTTTTTTARPTLRTTTKKGPGKPPKADTETLTAKAKNTDEGF